MIINEIMFYYIPNTHTRMYMYKIKLSGWDPSEYELHIIINNSSYFIK